MRLDIGCGEHPKPGYVGVDIRQFVDLDNVRGFTDAADLRFCEDGSVEAIYSRHMLEHLTRGHAARALAEWFRVLMPGGTVEIVVPDLAFHAQQLLGQWDGVHGLSMYEHRQAAMKGLYGAQGHEHDFHRWGYTNATLSVAMTASGFTDVHLKREMDQDSFPWHLRMVGKKPSEGQT